jgi:hypothetical protein
MTTEPIDDRGAIDLEALVDGFARLSERFADLDFLDRGGRLDLHKRIPAASCVRIELPSTEMLRLRSVIIEADGLDHPVRQTTRKASSALTKEWAGVLQRGRLLQRKNREIGITTRREDRPWVEIAFERPFDLTRILLRNTDDDQSVRARGVQVLVRTEDGSWTTVYDGVAREREFVRAAERDFRGDTLVRRVETLVRRRLGRERPATTTAVGADLTRVLTSIHLRDYANIFKDIDRIDLPVAEMSRFRKLVSDRLVGRRQLEWNIHGIKRSFRFWSEQEKQDYLGFAVDVADCLRQINDNVCFGFGSVLSVVRDHDLIPHDDDLDVLIGFERDDAPTLARGLQLMKECLQDGGFVVEGNFTSYHWVFPPSGEGQKLDAFAGLFEGDAISWYPGKRGALTRQLMFPPRTMPLLGLDCPVPREPERYLEQVYGPDWSVPNPHFRHTWRRSEYADIAR